MPKVFVVQDNGRFNLTAAVKFGTLQTLLPARMQIQLDAAEVIETIKSKLIEYCDDDSVLAIGDPAAIGIALSIAHFYNNGSVYVLKFDRQTNDYYRVHIDLTDFYVVAK